MNFIEINLSGYISRPLKDYLWKYAISSPWESETRFLIPAMFYLDLAAEVRRLNNTYKGQTKVKAAPAVMTLEDYQMALGLVGWRLWDLPKETLLELGSLAEGVGKVFYKSGQPERETPYKNGKENGVARGFFESGQVKWEIPYKNGEKEVL